MSVISKLTSEHVGKFVVIRADDRFIAVKIISVGDGMLGCSVLDQNMPMRSFKMRYKVDVEFEVFDTAEEAIEKARWLQ